MNLSIYRSGLWQGAAKILLAWIAVGCATHKPCSEAGDTTWPTVVRGDKVCHQKELPGGRIVNNGRFVQYYPSGKIFLEGAFKEGEKDGYWYQYNETGKKVVEKYFENGLEKSPPAPTSSQK